MNRLQKQTASKAIPLCLPDNMKYDSKTGTLHKIGEVRHNLYIVDEAVEQLRKIKEPISVVSIVGPFRDGKSFILSETFYQPDVFPVGHKMDPKTRGIWIWILPNKFKDRSGRDLRVVLLDSEGTNSTDAEGQHDNQIFILTVLLASVLIYNSKGVPKRNDLNELNYIVRLSSQIQARSDIRTSSPIKNEDAFRQTFPHFVWLLRDVLTEISDDFKDIKEYILTRVFKAEKASKTDVNHCVAESILHFFAGFDAFCLPIPTCNKEHIKDTRKYRDKLNPEFFTEVNRFQELLRSILGPKKSCNKGELVTGEGLATLTKLYIEAINDPSNVPNVQTAWETFVQGKRGEAKRKALVAYDNKMKAELLELPCDDDKMQASHESASRSMIAVFNEETYCISSERIKTDYEKLTEKGVEKLRKWKNKNDDLTEKLCEKLVNELKEKHLDPVFQRIRGPQGEKVSFMDIDNGCALIEVEYKSNAVGSKEVRARVLSKFHQKFQIVRDEYKDVLRKLKDYNESLLNTRLENTRKDEEMERLRTQTDYLTKEMKIQDEKMKQLEEKKGIELQEKLKEQEAIQNMLTNKLHDVEMAGMERKMHDLTKERDDAKENSVRTERELRNLKAEFSELKEQLRLYNRSWFKKLFNIDGEKKPSK